MKKKVETLKFDIMEDSSVLKKITHLVLNNFPKDGEKHKVFFVVQNERDKYYWGTDYNDLDLEVIQKHVKDGTLQKLKEPIFIRNGQGLWCEGEELNLYVGEKIADSISFSTVPLGRFYDLVIK